MQENRKEIIINEIIYWKENHLLSEQYCDFLLALYTEGNGYQKEKKKNYYYLLLIPLALFLILLYFTELSLILQIVFYAIFLIFGLWLIYFFIKNNLMYQIPIIILAFILLFVSVHFTLPIAANQGAALYIVLLANCILWWLIGWKFKQLYFTISGVIGLGLLILFFFLDINLALSL